MSNKQRETVALLLFVLLLIVIIQMMLFTKSLLVTANGYDIQVQATVELNEPLVVKSNGTATETAQNASKQLEVQGSEYKVQ